MTASTTHGWIRRLRVPILALPLVFAAGAAIGAETRPGDGFAGRTLIEALQEVQARGLKLIYSSDVVRPEMVVAAEPASRSLRGILRDLLEPHGLEARKGPGGVLLIVRADGPAAGGIEGILRPHPSMIVERIVVTPDASRSAEIRPDSGRLLEGEEIRAAPSLGDDLQRAVAAQPGLASGDRSAEFSVRGGAPNEVLVLFDGQELHDPFHLKDFHRFSGIVDPAAVGDARLFAEAFPAEYGDRMSGVLDLSSSIPAAPGETIVSSSFLNSRFLTGGRFRSGAGHWLVSARAWYPDAVVPAIDREAEGFRPAYSDWFGKAQVPLGPEAVLTAHFLTARDGVDFTDPDGDESADAESGTRYAWITLDSLWSPRVHSRTLLSYGRVQSGRIGRIQEDGDLVAGVDDDRTLNLLGFGQDWTFQRSDRLLLKWGASADWLDSGYDYEGVSVGGSPSWIDGSPTPPQDRSIHAFVTGRQIGGYAAAQFRPAGSLTVETGVRWDRQTHTGEDQFSPRVSLVQSLGPSSRLRAAWGRYYQSQGLHELQVADGVTGFFPAQLAEHYALGYEREFRNGLALRAGAYWKEMSGLSPRFENLFSPFELIPEFEPDRVEIAPDRAEAKGFDLTLARSGAGPFDWWASYSRSTIEDEIDGAWVPRSWDQPHAFRFGLACRRGGWELGLAGVYHTGWPTTSVGATSVQDPNGSTTIEPVLGPRNGDRFPDYHRLDARIGRHFRLGRGRLTLFAEVTNLYDRENVCCAEDFTFVPQADGSVFVQREDGLWMQRVPSLGITWRFDH